MSENNSKIGSERSGMTSASLVEALNAAHPRETPLWTRETLFVFICAFAKIGEDEDHRPSVTWIRSPEVIAGLMTRGLPSEVASRLSDEILREIADTGAAIINLRVAIISDSKPAEPEKLEPYLSAAWENGRLNVTFSNMKLEEWASKAYKNTLLTFAQRTRKRQVEQIRTILLHGGLSSNEAHLILAEQGF
jgi:hypothetical protein